MVLRTIDYKGNETSLTDNLYNFILDPTDGLVFEPTNGSEKVDGLAYRSHQIQDSLSPSWVSASYTITRDTDISPADYRLLTTLYGVTDNGTMETIGEDLITTCATTESTETRNFLFHKCTQKPYFTMDTGTASAGKINLNLPMRGENFTDLKIYKTHTFFDDFGDGKWGRAYNDANVVRSTPYTDWLNRAGTAAIESSSPIVGSYSLKHTGDGTNSIINRLYQTGLTSGTRPYKISFLCKCVTQGSTAGTPHMNLWILRYKDTNNYLLLYTYYTSGTNRQVIALGHNVGGSWSVINEQNWLVGKMDTSTVYQFDIIDTGSYINVTINGTNKINTSYTSSITNDANLFGFGCNYETAALWDNISYYTLKEDKVYSHGTSCDTLGAEDMAASFTLPSYWGINTPTRFAYQRVDNNEYKGNTVMTTTTNTARMGYHGLGNYKTLGLRFESQCNDEYTFNISNIRFKYEV